MKKKMVVFGVGGVADMIYNKIDFSRVEILGFVNPYTFKADNIKEFKGLRVLEIEEVKNLKYDFLLIASGNVSVVKDKIAQVGLDTTKVVACIADIDNDGFFPALKDDINKKYTEFLNDGFMSVIAPSFKRNPLYPVTTLQVISHKQIESSDFVRHKQLELIAHRIYEGDIEGSVAECGVYKGEFAKEINRLFPDRDLYLFDTVEGFDVRSIEAETSVNVDSTKHLAGGGGGKYRLNANKIFRYECGICAE